MLQTLAREQRRGRAQDVWWYSWCRGCSCRSTKHTEASGMLSAHPWHGWEVLHPSNLS